MSEEMNEQVETPELTPEEALAVAFRGINFGNMAKTARENYVLVTPEELPTNEKYCLVLNRALSIVTGKNFYNILWEMVVQTIQETAKRKYVDSSRRASALNRIFINKLAKAGFEIRARRSW